MLGMQHACQYMHHGLFCQLSMDAICLIISSNRQPGRTIVGEKTQVRLASDNSHPFRALCGRASLPSIQAAAPGLRRIIQTEQVLKGSLHDGRLLIVLHNRPAQRPDLPFQALHLLAMAAQAEGRRRRFCLCAPQVRSSISPNWRWPLHGSNLNNALLCTGDNRLSGRRAGVCDLN